ncbi:MAG: D-2-hydroxyacid dehydrogenase [Anaerolineae bacterium]|nr:D-2-hydroxyacid dehydrogenase [Anaerolineae bacterium]
MAQDTIRVVVAMDFSDEIMHSLRAISPRLHIERHFPNVADNVWEETEVLYTLRHYPDPALAPHLRWIQMHTAGIDHAMKQPIIRAEDVEVTNASGVHAVQMGEYVMGMMLAFAYRVPLLLEYQAKGEWPQKPHSIFSPRELRGQTLGIVGYGSVGREVARLAQTFGMTILATKRDLKHVTDDEGYAEPGTGDPDGSIPARLYPPEALASMATECDYLVVIVPQIEGTPPVIDETVLDSMKKSAVLVNVARGAVVDEAALITALSSGKIAGAVLDVFKEEPLPSTSPLWNLDNVILTPHVSGNSSRLHEKCAALFAENLQRYVEKRPLLNRVNRKRGY